MSFVNQTSHRRFLSVYEIFLHVTTATEEGTSGASWWPYSTYMPLRSINRSIEYLRLYASVRSSV